MRSRYLFSVVFISFFFYPLFISMAFGDKILFFEFSFMLPSRCALFFPFSEKTQKQEIKGGGTPPEFLREKLHGMYQSFVFFFWLLFNWYSRKLVVSCFTLLFGLLFFVPSYAIFLYLVIFLLLLLLLPSLVSVARLYASCKGTGK